MDKNFVSLVFEVFPQASGKCNVLREMLNRLFFCQNMLFLFQTFCLFLHKVTLPGKSNWQLQSPTLESGYENN